MFVVQTLQQAVQIKFFIKIINELNAHQFVYRHWDSPLPDEYLQLMCIHSIQIKLIEFMRLLRKWWCLFGN